MVPDYSIFGRVLRFCIGIVVPVAWLYFAPFGKLFAGPFGLATLGYAAWSVAWLILLLPLGSITISLFYMAITGRDAVHFWDPE